MTDVGQIRTQNVSILSEMVGCIIGHTGTTITEVPRLRGSKISASARQHWRANRMSMIQGTPEKALYFLYNQRESEKKRDVNRELACMAAAVCR